MASGQQVSSVVFGGLFIGVWLYLALFGLPPQANFDAGSWALWGFIGLVLAGAMYGTRVTKGAARIVLYSIVGLTIGMLLAATIIRQIPEGLAALLTFVGGGLIVTALPRTGQAE